MISSHSLLVTVNHDDVQITLNCFQYTNLDRDLVGDRVGDLEGVLLVDLPRRYGLAAPSSRRLKTREDKFR